MCAWCQKKQIIYFHKQFSSVLVLLQLMLLCRMSPWGSANVGALPAGTQFLWQT